MTRRSLIGAIRESTETQPINKSFLRDVMLAIEKRELLNRGVSSKYYKPSSCICLRQMYFMRTGEIPDDTSTAYNGIGMADTGTRRHVAIQEVLEDMKNLGYDWEYVDVAEYVKEKQSLGKLQDIVVTGTRGAETKLHDEKLHVSFMCDGVLKNLKTNKYYLFEFKNQASFKYNGKESVDKEHIEQVTLYCALLDLDEALVLYENRDTCMLECPELLQITQEMKEIRIGRLLECESYVESNLVPPRHTDTKICRWCKYLNACKNN